MTNQTTTGQPAPAPAPDRHARAERRIAILTLAFGLGGAVLAAWLWSAKAGIGVAAGGVLAWINGLWMADATRAIARLSVAQAGAEKPRISKWVYARFFARYALMAVVIYAMFTRFQVPVASVLAGLLALGAAVIVQGLTEAATRSSAS